MKNILLLLVVYNSLFAQGQLDSIPLSVTFEEEAIVVTGQYTPTNIQSSVLPIRVITKEMIERRAATTLTEIFQQEAGIRIKQDPVLGTVMTMNGLKGKHIKILINGVPMIGRNDGNLDLDRIQIQDVERIEIIENAMSVTYGTDALGGTINIITKKGKKDNLSARIVGQVQSNQQYNTAISLGGNWKGFSINCAYNFNHFDGFSADTLRSQEWNPKQQHSFGVQLYYNIPSSTISIGYQFSYLNEKIDNKGIIKLASFPALSYAKDYEFMGQSQDHSFSILGYLDKKKFYYLDALVSFNYYARQKNGYFRSLNDNTDVDVFDENDSDSTTFQAWNVRAMLASQYQRKLDFQLGVDIRYDYTTGARLNQGHAVLGDYALFANLRYRPISKLILDAGIRVAYNTLANVPVTYSIGAKLKIIDGMNLRFSYARGIRTPSLKELYLDFSDVNHNIVGNPNLKPEYAHNIRLGWIYNKAFFGEHIINLSLGGFYNYIEQQIVLFNYDLDSSGNYIINSQSTKYAYFNLEEYQNWGLDAKLKYQYKGLTIQFGTVLIGHYNSLNKDYKESINPFQYTVEFVQEVSYQFKKIDLTFSLFRRDYDKQIRYTATTDPITTQTTFLQNTTDSYGLMDFSISKGFWNNGIVITAGIKNVLNIVEVNQSGNAGSHGGGSSGGLSVGMGRIYFVRLVCQPFNFKKSKSLSER
jgi:outer membrane receptor for ferrienterochelin and colicins